MLQQPLSADIPDAFKAAMLQLEDRATAHLSKHECAKAKGIVENIRRYGRVTEKQHKEVMRLLAKSKRPFKARTHRFEGYRDGATYISAEERRRRNEEAIAHAERYSTDADYRASWDREEARKADSTEAVLVCLGKPGGSIDRELLRNDIKHYWPADHLPKALPGIIQPHLKPRRDIIACLIRRLRALRAEGIPPGTNDRAAALHRIRKVRAALIAEGLAELRYRQTIRNDEAAA